VRLLFDLLSSCSGLLKHAAPTTRPPSTLPPLTFNVRQSCTPRVGPCAVDVAQVAATAMALTAEAYDTAVQTLLAVQCAGRARCRDRPTGVTEPGVLDVVPLSVATGNVMVYFTALSYSHRVVVTLACPSHVRHRSGRFHQRVPAEPPDERLNSYLPVVNQAGLRHRTAR
jgi:hypothetical protein